MLVCGACATYGPAPVEPGGFQLRGKLGVVDGAQSHSARFLWLQQGPEFTIELWGPLGQGRVRLTGDADDIAVRDGNGSVVDRGSHDEVLERHLGWSLPLHVLPEWVLGRPSDRLPAAHAVYDADGRLTGFEQLDWRVSYDRFREPGAGEESKHADGAESAGDTAAGRWLPGKITASRGDYRVRLAISDWQI